VVGTICGVCSVTAYGSARVRAPWIKATTTYELLDRLERPLV